MSSNKLDDFPDVEAKLQKPSKQSAFEKQKADAEAKRKREAAETAAVYESFVKSFDNDEDERSGFISQRHDNVRGQAQSAPFGPSARESFGGGASKRHFGASLGSSGLKSGPGSLGPAPSMYGKKRGFDNLQQGYGHDRNGRDERRGVLGFDDDGPGISGPPPKSITKAFEDSDDEDSSRAPDRAEERAVAKPTLRLANLPPGTSPAVIKALMPTSLAVENVKILSTAASSSTERKSVAAIVTLSKETPATDMDAAVSALQNRYLGFGFYLSLHRHLSSAVTSAVTNSSLASNTVSHAFGAKPVVLSNDQQQPHPHHRGFAPPSSFGPAGGGPIQRNALLHVPVRAPHDIKQLQLIHKVVESVLEHGPDFEALLMSRPDVQKEEKWAWLWDARSEGGVWYRWRLWEVLTGTQSKGTKQGKYLPLFEGSHAWKLPEKPLSYEYATGIEEFISDSEYNSSDDEDYEEEGNKPSEGGGPNGEKESMYLNPLEKAKVTHFLSRLPTTLGRIRKGDIARVTTFAITHANRGADEIVDLIVSNIEKPFALCRANPEFKPDENENGGGNGRQGSVESTAVPEDMASKANAKEAVDTSASSLVGLYIVSDILSSSATSGVRHAWRYRQLFESALKDRKTFEYLGLMAERLHWGRLRAEKWKRSVSLVLSLWEGWCVFPADSQALFMQTFESPPSAKKEENTEEGTKKGRWKTMETASNTTARDGKTSRGFLPISTAEDGAPGTHPVNEDVDGDAMEEDEFWNDDVEMDDDIDGVPMDDEDNVAMGSQDEMMADAADEAPISAVEPEANKADDVRLATGQSRRRMRAVDMFADSDDSEAGT